ncbi:hypothetical protein V8E55_011518 [Tylopilus felleus]
MTKFKRVFSRLLRLRPKSRASYSHRAVITPAANTAVTYRKSSSRNKRALLALAHAAQYVQPSPDAVPEDVEEVEEDDDEGEGEGEYHDKDDKDITEVFPYDLVRDTNIEVDVQNAQPLSDTIPEIVEEVEEYEDEDTPEVFPYDLVRKTHTERMTQHLYVALADNDREIAALRTVDREKFNHIVRIVFKPLSRRGNILPSSWSTEEIHRDDGPSELRLTCPGLTLHFGDKLTALTEKQLLAARNYVTQSLPERNDRWAAQGFQFPFSPEECKDARVLIVGPPIGLWTSWPSLFATWPF